MEDKLIDMEKQSDDDARLDERRRVNGAWQVWEEQLRRVNRYYARFEAINRIRYDVSHYKANDEVSEYETDDVYSFFVNCYHLVEWLGEDVKYRRCKGRNPCQLTSCPECWVNRHEALGISRDLCNRVKHVRLDKGEPGKPRLITHGVDEPDCPSHRTHLIQWPDRATFDKKWCEIKREHPDAFPGKTSEEGFKQGYWNDGDEQKCWLAAYDNGRLRDAFEVATEARENWKQFFVAPEADKDWIQIHFWRSKADADELYEEEFGPDKHKGRRVFLVRPFSCRNGYQ